MRLHETGSYVHDDDPGEPSTGNPRLSVTDAEATILMGLVAGKSVLEIGTGLGVSTRAMAETATTVHTFDIDPWVREVIWPDLPKNVVTHRTSLSMPRCQVAFIDGDHTAEATDRDLIVAYAKARELIVVHDALHPMVADVLGDSWDVIETEHGLAVKRLR